MIITFVHGKQSFLPEISAYTRLFESLGINCQTALPEEIGETNTDVEWHFMGFDTGKSRRGRIKIHEYTSASTAPFRTLKDFGKKILNVKPHFRIFLNEYVRKTFSFNDNVSSGYRDMGVDEEWANHRNKIAIPVKYDCVYIGDLGTPRQPERLLDLFAYGSMKQKTLLIISHNYAQLQHKYTAHRNIIFEGPYPYSDISAKLKEARYGINYIVDKAPYNQQTSTKLLEYAVCGLPVITTHYAWIKEFMLKYGGKYFYLNSDLSNLIWEKIEEFQYSSPDLSDWTWEKRIRASGVLEFLKLKI